MPETVRHGDGQVEHPEVRYEKSDANFNWIMAIIIGSLILGVFLHVAVWGFYDHYRAYQAEIKQSPYPLAPTPSTSLPPSPRLEQLEFIARDESANVFDRMARHEAILHRYGMTAEEGYARVPIEQAIDYLAGKLPSREEPSAAQQKRAGGLVDAGESNSGRMFRKEER
jgi:hypothetical protein